MAQPDKNTVIYDDLCPMCTFQMRVVSWLDWFSALRLMPMSDPRAVEIAAGVTREELRERMVCATPAGRLHRGARAVRHLALRVPLLVPLALLMWVPGVIWIAEWVYTRVAHNRYVLSRLLGCKTACRVLPPREKKEDADVPTS